MHILSVVLTMTQYFGNSGFSHDILCDLAQGHLHSDELQEIITFALTSK